MGERREVPCRSTVTTTTSRSVASSASWHAYVPLSSFVIASFVNTLVSTRESTSVTSRTSYPPPPSPPPPPPSPLGTTSPSSVHVMRLPRPARQISSSGSPTASRSALWPGRTIDTMPARARPEDAESRVQRRGRGCVCVYACVCG